MGDRKYNTQTKCYKIDVYLNGVYQYSTDMSKSCKEAKNKFIKKNNIVGSLRVQAFFDRN